MIKHALSKEAHTLTEQEILVLVKMTEGFSGSDMSILMKGVYYLAVEEFERTDYFIQVGITQTNQPIYMPSE